MKKLIILTMVGAYALTSSGIAEELTLRCETRVLSDDKNFNAPNEDGYVKTFGKLSDVNFFKYDYSFFKGHRFFRRNANNEWSDLVLEAKQGKLPTIIKEKYFLFTYPEGEGTAGYEELDFLNGSWTTGTGCPVTAENLLDENNRKKCPTDALDQQFLDQCILE